MVTPFGKFKYKHLPMGINMAPDIAQEIMEELLHDLEFTNVYIDDIGVWSNSYEDRMRHLDVVLN